MKTLAIAAVLVVSVLFAWVLFHESSGAGPLDQVRDRSDVDGASDTREIPSPGTLSDPTLEVRRSTAESEVRDVQREATLSLAQLGALRVQVRWSDGTGADNVAVTVEPNEQTAGTRPRFRRTTDASGVAFFPALPAGVVRLETDRGAVREDDHHEEKPEIRAGRTSEIELQLEGGLRITGTVVEANGAPVSRASIWLTSGNQGWTGGRVVATSDEHGAFELQDVPGTQSLGAFGEGYAPGTLVDLDLVDTAVQPIEVRLEVTVRGGAVAGRITGENGDPIDDAIVVTGRAGQYPDYRSNGTWAERWTPRMGRTNESGGYRIDGVEVGEQAVWIRRTGLPIWKGTVEVRAHEVARLDAVLLPGATLSGQVTNADGEPVPGARVHAFEVPISEHFITGGQIDYESPFAHVSVTADDSGRYRMSTLPPGEMWIYVQEPRPERSAMDSVVQFVKRDFEFDSGGAYTWDPVLSDGRTIHGLARYLNGDPIENVFISARPNSGAEARSIYTRDGTFKFIQLEDDKFDVTVQMWDAPDGSPPVGIFGIAPGTGPVEIIAEFDAPKEYEESVVIVRVEDEAGRAGNPDAIGVILESTRKLSWRFGDRSGDTWTFKVNEPDTYTPIVVAGEQIIAVGEPFESVPGERHDLGTLRTKTGGKLLLQIQRDEGTESATFKAWIKIDACRRSQSIEVGAVSEYILEGIEPGSGEISIHGEGIVSVDVPFEVDAGRQATVTIPLEQAAEVPYKIHWDLSDRPKTLSFKFLDRSTGSVVREINLENLHRYKMPIDWKFRTGPGSFTLEAELGNGKKGRVDFEVTRLDPESLHKVEIDLR